MIRRSFEIALELEQHGHRPLEGVFVERVDAQV
jgi:hypothetical protein